MTTAQINLTNQQVIVTGQLDKVAVAELSKQRVDLSGGENYQLNLTGLDHIDSAGLAYLVNLICQQQHSGGEIRVVSLTEQVQQLIDLSDVAMLFQQ